MSVTLPGPIAQGFGQLPQLIATQGYVSSSTPPVVVVTTDKQEYGAALLTALRIGHGQPIIGPWQTVDRVQLEIIVYARGPVDFDLNYEFSTDQGTTWYVGEQVAAVSKSFDDGTNFAKEAHGHFNVGYWWRISVFNTSLTTANDIAYEWRLHEY